MLFFAYSYSFVRSFARSFVLSFFRSFVRSFTKYFVAKDLPWPRKLCKSNRLISIDQSFEQMPEANIKHFPVLVLSERNVPAYLTRQKFSSTFYVQSSTSNVPCVTSRIRRVFDYL